MVSVWEIGGDPPSQRVKAASARGGARPSVPAGMHLTRNGMEDLSLTLTGDASQNSNAVARSSV